MFTVESSMEDFPRAQSALPTRQSGFQLKTSKIIQKASTFKSLLRFPGRRSKADTSGPYTRHTQSLDVHVKPYMSQPVLNLRNPRDSYGGSSHSDSPVNSPSRSDCRHSPTPGIFPRNTSPAQVKQPLSVQVATPAAGLPVTLSPSYTYDIQQSPTSIINISGLPPTQPSPPPIPAPPKATPDIVISASTPPATQTTPTDRPRSSSDTHRPWALSSKRSKTRLTDSSSISSRDRDARSTLTERSSATQPPLPTATTAITSTLSRRTTAPATSTPQSGMMNHPASLRPASTIIGSASQKRQSGAPRIGSLPPMNHRFSLTENGLVRLSPTIISRTPPVALNLPPLPTFPPIGTQETPASREQLRNQQRRESRIGLRSIPALPLQGSADTTSGDHEDDEGSEDDDEGEDEASEDGDERSRSQLTLSVENEENGRPRSSMSSSGSTEHDERLQATASYHPDTWNQTAALPTSTTIQGQSSSYFPTVLPTRSLHQQLPPVDTSRLDVSFLGDGDAGEKDGHYHPYQQGRPPSGENGNKGKGKSTEHQSENEATPTITSSRSQFLHSSGSSSATPILQVGMHHDGLPTSIPRVGSANAASVSPRLSVTAPSPIRQSAPTSLHTHPSLSRHPAAGSSTSISATTARPGLYKHGSKSLIDIHAIQVKMAKAEEEAKVQAAERRRSMGGRKRISQLKVREGLGRVKEASGDGEDMDFVVIGEEAGPSSARVEAEANAGDEGEQTPSGGQNNKRMSSAPAYDTLTHPLRRRRSMPIYNAASQPPPYPSFAPHPYAHPMGPNVMILPREDEGKERLPPYSNSIYIKGIMPRKMEFTKPGVLAKDRKWRRVVCVLQGTAFKVYRCPAGVAGVSVLGEWWERKVGVGDVSVNGAPAAGASATGGPAARAEEEARRRAWRAAKLERDGDGAGGPGQTELLVVPPQQTPPPVQQEAEEAASQSRAPTSRSRLGNILKPGRLHARSISDASSNPGIYGAQLAGAARSSLNIPRSSHGAGSGTNSRPGSSNGGHSMQSQASGSTLSLSMSTSGSTLGSSRPSSSMGREIADRDPSPSELIKAYSMQHAESGLGDDYVKRRNVIRLRLDGEQFLLQARDAAEVVQWIEALHSAANVALDLDERSMPKGPLFPRRRRRRAPRRPAVEPARPLPSGSTAPPTL